jgi:hypothetical protein
MAFVKRFILKGTNLLKKAKEYIIAALYDPVKDKLVLHTFS